MHGFKKDSKEVIPGLRTDSEWINTWAHIGFIMDYYMDSYVYSAWVHPWSQNGSIHKRRT